MFWDLFVLFRLKTLLLKLGCNMCFFFATMGQYMMYNDALPTNSLKKEHRHTHTHNNNT